MNGKSTAAVLRAGLCVLLVAVGVLPAGALGTYWQHDPATPGDWFEPANWDNGVPQAGSWNSAYINNGGEAQITAIGAEAGYFYLGKASGESGAVHLSGTGQLSGLREYIGHYGMGTFTQTGGTHTLASLDVGYWSGSQGIYELSGTGELSNAGSECMGWYGTGTFIQTAGTHAVGGELRVGSQSGSQGTYELSGTGQLSVWREYIGGEGTGTFIQTSGTHTVDEEFYLAYASGSEGTYGLSGGAQLSAHEEYIGQLGTATFNQTGGSNSTGYLSVNPASRYQFSGGTLTVTDSAEVTGTLEFAGGNGSLLMGGLVNLGNASLSGAGSTSFTLSPDSLLIVPAGFDPAFEFGSFTNQGSILHEAGSTLTVPAGRGFTGTGTIEDHVECEGTISAAADNGIDLLGGLRISGSGSVHLGYGGTLRVDDELSGISDAGELSVGWAEYIGYDGTATFTQTGGTHAVDRNLYLGWHAGSQGTYELSGTAQLTVERAESLGRYGTGTFNQSGGSNTTAYLSINSASRYELSGGTLTVTDGAKVLGAVDFAGGNASVVMGGLVNLGNASLTGAGSTSFALRPDSLLIVPEGFDADQEFGTFSNPGHSIVHQHGSTLIVPAGRGFTGAGTIDDHVVCEGTISAASGYSEAFTFNGGLTISGGGTVNLGAGGLTVDNNLFEISGNGQLSVGADEYIGRSATGSFTQAGGTHTVNDRLYLGHSSGSQGSYELGGAGQLCVGGYEYIGRWATGTFTQTGGTHTIEKGLYLGWLVGGQGTYELSGTGQLSVAERPLFYDEYIGYYGTGTFTQTGGTHMVHSSLYFGWRLGSQGTYELSGAGELSVEGNEQIGFLGTGTFTQTGGTHTVGGPLEVGYSRASEGTYVISAGQLSVRSIWLARGSGGSGTLKITGPEAEISVLEKLGFGPGSSFAAVPGSIIHMTGAALENESIDPQALAGLENLTLIFEGGEEDIDPFEVAGEDMGPVTVGFEDNFALGTLQLGGADIGKIQLVDDFDNQPGWQGSEALYVWNLSVGPSSYLDLNGLNLYYVDGTIDPTATIVGGTPTLIPEPSSLLLLAMAAVGLLAYGWRRWRRVGSSSVG